MFLEALTGTAAGDVLVIDNGGRVHEICIGDLVALQAGQSHNRNADTHLPHFAQDFGAAHAGHFPIQHDQRVAGGAQLFQRLAAVGGKISFHLALERPRLAEMV